MNKRLLEIEGATVPFGIRPGETPSSALEAIRNGYLRFGRVVTTYAPDNSKNTNKKYTEYDVEIHDDSPISVITRYTMYRCQVSCSFGGAGDYSTWTPRASQNPSDALTIGDENWVLVLCVNGWKQRGLIIGGFRNPKAEKDEPESGHHAVWQFNGVRAVVDKDGQFKLSFRGATQDSGELASSADKDASGATFQITKDGSLKLFTKDEGQLLDLNHAQKTVSLTSDKEMTLTSKSALIKTSSTGVHLGNATDAMVKGTTYRRQEAAMNTVIATSMQALAAALTPLTPAIAAGAATSDPMVAAAMGAVSTAISAIQAAATTMSEAVKQFEAQSPEYLSTRNKLD